MVIYPIIGFIFGALFGRMIDKDIKKAESEKRRFLGKSK